MGDEKRKKSREAGRELRLNPGVSGKPGNDPILGPSGYSEGLKSLS